MRTKIYLLLIALVATIGSAWGQAAVGTEFLDGGINYKVVSASGEVEVARYVVNSVRMYAGEFRIPTTANDGTHTYDVVGIGLQAFKDSPNVTLIEIPEGVTYIDEEAFRHCENLVSLSIPASVVTISDNFVFALCNSLPSFGIDEDNISFKEEGGVLFTADGKKLIYYLPLVHNEESYTIPSGVETIITGSFLSERLLRVNIPSSVLTIQRSAFGSHQLFEGVTVSPDNPNYSSADGVLFTKDGKRLITYPAGRNETSYVVPEGVEIIGQSAFTGVTKLTSVSLPESLRTIEMMAFRNTTSLTSIIIPDGVTRMDGWIFEGSGLITIEIPNSVVNFGDGMFSGCSSLKSAVLGEHVKVNNHTFDHCTALETLVLKNPNPNSFSNATFASASESLQVILPVGSEGIYGSLITPGTITNPILAGYSIVFDSRGGSIVPSQSSEVGVPTTKPSDPIKVGYSLDKWLNSADDTEWDFTTPIVEHITLYATYVIGQYDITLNPNGGSVSVTKIENITYGTSIGTLPTPQRVNHTFDGWFDSDGNEYNSDDIFAPSVPDNFVLIASWTLIARTQYTVTINPLSGVRVNKTSTTVGEGNSFGFTAEAIASGYSVNVSVNGSPLSAISGINYLIEDIRENKTITFSLVRGGTSPNPPPVVDPVIPGPGYPAGPGQIIIDENTPSDLGKLPGDGQIIVRPPLVDPNSPTPPKVTIDGKEVDGHWTTDKDGNPVFVIDLDGLEDGDHTIVINDKEFDFTVDSSPVIPGPGTPGGPGQIIIDENTPSEIPGEFPGDGQIIVRPPLVDPNDPTPPKVIIDGKEVEGEWKTDEDGNPVFVIDLDGLEDGKHTIIINDKEFEFTVDKNARPTSNDVLSTATVAAGYGSVTIDTPKSATVYIVSFSGSVVYNAKVIGTATVNVPAGIYVVVVDGSVTKVVVR